ncbi:hypothetical protein [Buttiauxella agrestis]|uniref:Putative membrane protein n=2 Tax=Buttiauxella agrestis TaxID=82977 RepID=A0A085G490_9ENTR|nr:hypothetical protein [Buttiauxella agrestis]KFC78535.1 putative membrane protein [Buttiauxella agrestis ATCC 33320]
MSELRNSKNKPHDYLRDEHQFQTYPSMNPVLRDMAAINGDFITESRYIMLLTIEEAQGVSDELLGNLDYFFSYKLGPGNIKDGLDGFRTLSKLTTYYSPTGKLVFNFNYLKIKAVEYVINGKAYIKITGYAGVRRILTGTRYGATNPQMLEMAIGMRGFGTALIKGMKFCIYASLALRGVELIFKSDYHLVDFLVDIPMDIAKIIVSSVAIGIVGGVMTFFSFPVVIIAGFIIGIGIILNNQLNHLDNEMGLSTDLKNKIRDAIIEQQKMSEWDYQHLAPFSKPLHERGF